MPLPPQQQQQQPQPQPGGMPQAPSGGGMLTGLARQVQSRRLQAQRGMVASVGQQLQQGEAQFGIASGRAAPGAQQAQPGGASPTSSVNNMALQLARSYGLPIGSSGQMVDQYGNITYQPQSEDEMIKLQMVSDAIYNRQVQESHARGVAAQTAGMGLVRQRGRGSLALMQSGMYQNLASLYANQEFQQADYTLMIQSEQLKRAERIQAERAREAKKSRLGGSIGSIIGGAAGLIIGGPAGGMIGTGLGGEVGSSLASLF